MRKIFAPWSSNDFNSNATDDRFFGQQSQQFRVCPALLISFKPGDYLISYGSQVSCAGSCAGFKPFHDIFIYLTYLGFDALRFPHSLIIDKKDKNYHFCNTKYEYNICEIIFLLAIWCFTQFAFLYCVCILKWQLARYLSCMWAQNYKWQNRKEYKGKTNWTH